MKKTIYVGKRDIQGGTQMSPNNCAIARAIRRHLNLERSDVNVGPFQIDITLPTGQFFSVKQSPKATMFVGAFDRDKTSVNPFRFMLNIDESKTLPASPQVYWTKIVDFPKYTMLEPGVVSTGSSNVKVVSGIKF